MSEQFDKPPSPPSSRIPHPSVRHWWEQASEADQDAVLVNLKIDRELACVPWAFLPEAVQTVLTRRVRIEPKADT